MTEKTYFAGTHRSVHPEETSARVRGAAGSLGITRVADVTGLDFIGIPVVMVVRPASRTLSVQQGKGLSYEAAVASGLMEAFEASCAERIVGDVVLATAASISPSTPLVPVGVGAQPLPANTPIPWSQCLDMMSGRHVWLPSELVFADFTWPRPQGQGYFHPTSNGLASGNTRDEALLHALCEVIERDCIALWAMRRRRVFVSPLDLRTIADPHAIALIEKLDSAGMRVLVWDISSDLDVPCYFCVIDDCDSGRPPFLGRFVGSGCHPSAGIAVSRSLTEAAQSRLTVITGTRDDLEARRYESANWHRNTMTAISELSKGPFERAFEDRSFSTPTIEGDLAGLRRRLDEARIGKVLTASLPSRIAGLCCERVILPELESSIDKPSYSP